MKKRTLTTGTLPRLAAALLTALVALSVASAAHAGDGPVALIHTGDFHGHLVPRPNLRSESNGRMEGGLARVATVVMRIRAEKPDSLLLHTGDTIQGGAEVLYTRGDAIVAVLNNFGIDAFAPGNWEFVYGTERFLELFAGPDRKARWETIAANVMLTADGTERHALPPFLIRQVGGVKVGLLGMTTDRGPQVVGSGVTKGLRFLANARREGEDVSQVDRMVTRYVNELRNTQKVDLLVMLSELGSPTTSASPKRFRASTSSSPPTCTRGRRSRSSRRTRPPAPGRSSSRKARTARSSAGSTLR